jgi:hypothetical protein
MYPMPPSGRTVRWSGSPRFLAGRCSRTFKALQLVRFPRRAPNLCLANASARP